MSGIRSSRVSRTRVAGAAASLVLAALSLTACGDGTGASDNAAGDPTTASHPTTAAAATAPAGGTSSAPPVAPPSHSAALPSPPAAVHSGAVTVATKAPASSGSAVTCEGSNTRTVATLVQSPLNHMLLTVTNTGSRRCYLYTYPALRFAGAQAVPPVIEASIPQAVVTLDPGESGYASVTLSAGDGSGSNGRTEKSLTVYFQGRSGNGSVGASARPSLPATGVYIDDSLKTTYWQQSMASALAW